MLAFKYGNKNLLQFKDNCKITLLDNNAIRIEENGITEEYNEQDKPVFKNEQGECVTEYSGLATDKREDRSWAIARFEPNGKCSKHFHKERREIYYIISGWAGVEIDGVMNTLKAGDSIAIEPGQVHQVTNLSPTEELSLVVKCTKSWIYTDVHDVEAKPENKVNLIHK